MRDSCLRAACRSPRRPCHVGRAKGVGPQWWQASAPASHYLPSRRFSVFGVHSIGGKSVAKSESSKESAGHESTDHGSSLSAHGEKQARAPWHRDGPGIPPASKPRSAGVMTKGKLLTTPSRLLKLILPLTKNGRDLDRKDVEPLALLVHPQQPLSYLERLVQSELPVIKGADGNEKIPAVYFKAEDSAQDGIKPGTDPESKDDDDDFDREDLRETQMEETENRLRGGHGEGGVESYSGQGREGPPVDGAKRRKFVRWSSSTEIGDFIRDAARGKEFAVEIEGTPREIRVGVPSFDDRTHYLRIRLRKTARKILDMAAVKNECDTAARKGARQVAMGGFAVLVGWWASVYVLTFRTSYGWDVMEPVTYLVGLSTLMGGYGWFIYHNREVSYRSALNFTISRRQTQLYQAKGFDLPRWDALIEEGNALRKEIKTIANEYDVDWDEKEDEQHKEVTKALRKDRDAKKKENSKEKSEKDDGDDED